MRDDQNGYWLKKTKADEEKIAIDSAHMYDRVVNASLSAGSKNSHRGVNVSKPLSSFH